MSSKHGPLYRSNSTIITICKREIDGSLPTIFAVKVVGLVTSCHFSGYSGVLGNDLLDRLTTVFELISTN